MHIIASIFSRYLNTEIISKIWHYNTLLKCNLYLYLFLIDLHANYIINNLYKRVLHSTNSTKKNRSEKLDCHVGHIGYPIFTGHILITGANAYYSNRRLGAPKSQISFDFIQSDVIIPIRIIVYRTMLLFVSIVGTYTAIPVLNYLVDRCALIKQYHKNSYYLILVIFFVHIGR